MKMLWMYIRILYCNGDTNGKLSNVKSRVENVYVAVPYLPSIHNELKSFLKQLRLYNVKMAPKILVSNRLNFYSNTKDKRDLSNTINASFKIKCGNVGCNYEFEARTTSLDVERTFLHMTKNEAASPYLHIKQNPLHSLHVEPSSIKHYRSNKELQCIFES